MGVPRRPTGACDRSLEIIAREKKVSLAWVVREAAEKYIGDKWPLFNPKAGER
jgi:hypothetical protein